MRSIDLMKDGSELVMIAYSADVNVLATLHTDESCRLWDLKTTKCRHVLSCSMSRFGVIFFSPDGKYLVFTTYPVLKTWEVATGTELFAFELSSTEAIPTYSPDSRHLAVSGIEDNAISILNPATGESFLVLRGHGSEISKIVYSSDGTQIATASEDKTIRLWDARTGAPGPVFEGHVDSVKYVVFSPSGQQIASAGLDCCIRLWDTKVTRALNIQPRQNHQSFTKVHFIPGSSQYFVSHCKASLRLCDRDSGSFIRILEDRTVNTSYHYVTLSPCGRELAVAEYLVPRVLLYDITTGQKKMILELEHDGESSWVYSEALTYSPDGTRVVTTSGIDVTVWDRQTGFLKYKLTGHDKKVTLVLFSPNEGHQLASFSKDLNICLWDMSTGSCTWILKDLEARVAMASYSTDGSQLVTAYEDSCNVQVWDTTTGTSLRIIGTGCKNPLLFTPDGDSLVTYSDIGDKLGEDKEGTLQVWDITKGERIRTLCKTIGWAVAGISPDGRWLASSSYDEVVRLWDMRTGQQIAQTENYGGLNNSLALDIPTTAEGEDVGCRGLSLAVGSYSGDVSYWKLVEEELKDSDAPQSDETIVSGQDDENDNKTKNYESSEEKVGGKVNEKSHKFKLQWTTAYGKLSAEGAIIEGTKGLGRSNFRLLRQHGACGEAVATLGFQSAITKVMSSKNLLAKLVSRQITDNRTQDEGGKDEDKKPSQRRFRELAALETTTKEDEREE
ncbi:hypothetical protein BGX26_004100 [Mortierella sp. AD094]|nr:hypothetical protein BGX26_004100 [Mortierella sp. AD094]